ncbi:diguanylate cyclase [Vibrio mytili]|uniref:Diguanylate cyclase n=1 Tax=Vibrio mytili TaxID=50718 RepID=A0A0C3E6N3_9VIBR|nr:diguanylate cyclase [Vibrio mytili]KIN10063.1 diguanylate cyclase [Vibrio mytili]
MRYSPKKPCYFVSFFLTFFASCVGIIELVHHDQQNVYQRRDQIEAKDQLSVIRSNLEAILMADIYKVSTLATLISLLPNRDERDLRVAAERIQRKSKHISTIGIAPNDVVTHVFPLQGNESVLGLEYRHFPNQWSQVKKAREIQEIFIAGPISLVQGGRGLIARLPVFSDAPLNENYWGVISAVINFDSLLQDAGVFDFSYRYPLTIRGYDSSGEFGDIFFGTANDPSKLYAKEVVHFPYGGWSMAVFSGDKLKEQLPWYEVNIVRLIGYPMLLVLSIAIFVIYRLYIIANQRALHDELTRLPNRRNFMHSFKRQFEIAQRYQQDYSFALINIDLDRFKSINDTYGHNAGDKVLIAAAERILGGLRKSDIVARMGGDEFLAIVHNPQSEQSLEALIFKLKGVLSKTPIIYDEHLIYLEVSIGYAMFDPKMLSPEQMLKVADEKMYQQKHKSRD